MHHATTVDAVLSLVDQDDEQKLTRPPRNRSAYAAELPERLTPTTRLTPRQAGTYLQCSYRQIFRWIATRELVAERLSRYIIRVQVRDLDAFAARRRVSTLCEP